MENPKTLFLIDDDNDDLEFFCEAASKIDPGLVCITSNDSVAALKSFQNFDVPVPDLIFLDLNMPLVDGRKFLTEIKKLRTYSQIPVIIYSTSSHPRDQEETQKLGASGFLTKPYCQDDLIVELGNILAYYSFALTDNNETKISEA
jgi:CheY-like chemotaxis protein